MDPKKDGGFDMALGFAIVSVELAIICYLLREIALRL